MCIRDSGGRIHTSTITVAVMPEAEEVDVEIDEKDVRIDVMLSLIHISIFRHIFIIFAAM